MPELRFGPSARPDARPEPEPAPEITPQLQAEIDLVVNLKAELPPFPEALRGLEGIKAAHEMLLKHERAGILIGGLATAVWEQDATAETLAAHKDVDVAALGGMRLRHPFEAGVDWWLPLPPEEWKELPYTDGIPTRHEYVPLGFRNGNGALLPYNIDASIDEEKLAPGLYILHPDIVRDMESYTRAFLLRRSGQDVSDDAFGEAIAQIDATMTDTLMPGITDIIGERVISQTINWDLASSAHISLIDPVDLTSEEATANMIILPRE